MWLWAPGGGRMRQTSTELMANPQTTVSPYQYLTPPLLHSPWNANFLFRLLSGGTGKCPRTNQTQAECHARKDHNFFLLVYHNLAHLSVKHLNASPGVCLSRVLCDPRLPAWRCSFTQWTVSGFWKHSVRLPEFSIDYLLEVTEPYFFPWVFLDAKHLGAGWGGTRTVPAGQLLAGLQAWLSLGLWCPSQRPQRDRGLQKEWCGN